MSKRLSLTANVGLPHIALVVFGLLGGALQVVNFTVIPASARLHEYIAIALFFLIAAGITPVVGSDFKAALHVPAWLDKIITALLGAALLATTTLAIPQTTIEIISAAVTVLAGLGWSAAVQPIPVSA